jgi:hypothetical protein
MEVASLFLWCAEFPSVFQSGTSGGEQVAHHDLGDTLELNRKARVAVYRNVAANDRARGMSILADQIEFFFDERMAELDRALAVGNVRLSYGDRRGVAERAEYFPPSRAPCSAAIPGVAEQRCCGRLQITLLLRDDRSQVEGVRRGSR